jgi:signal peptidase II
LSPSATTSLSADSQSAVADRGGSDRLVWLIPVCIVVLDQITKWVVVSTMDLHQTVRIFGDWVCLTYILNPGGAFGVQWGYQGTYFAAAFIVIAWISWHLYRHGSERRLSHWALALILGGAIGNLIDRVLLGQVIDFVDVAFFKMRIPAFDLGFIHHPGYVMDRWPTFNVADSAVTVGVLSLLVTLWYDPVLCKPKSVTPTLSPDPNSLVVQDSDPIL